MQTSHSLKAVAQISDLHAARGIAAAIVLFHHISLVQTMAYANRLAIDTVLNAHAAVIFFFVLSGFVLTGSIARTGVNRTSVKQFLTRRAFRIYPALVAALAFALVIWGLGEPFEDGNKTNWYMRYSARFYDLNMGTVELLQNLIPVSFAVNPPTWSIFVELLGSFFIPLIFIWFSRGPLFILLGLMFFLVLSGIFVGKAAGFHYLNFTIFFALGAVIHFVNPLARMPRLSLCLIAAASGTSLLLCRMLYKALVLGEMTPIEVDNADWNMSLLEGGFAMVLIACMAAPQWKQNTLRMPRFLGDLSYSIYLFHFPVILLAVWLSAEVAWLSSPALLWVGVPVVTLLLATISFRYLEKPAIRMGHVVSEKIGVGNYANEPTTVTGAT